MDRQLDPPHTNRLVVTTWKDRVEPARRRFAIGLRSGIVARGRVRLPLARVGWLVDLFQGQTWVACLQRDLSSLVKDVDVTIELFKLLDRSLDLDSHRVVFQAYLFQRHIKQLADRRFHVASVEDDSAKHTFEDLLDLKVDALYKKPQVPLPGSRGRLPDERWALLVYASFPTSIEPFVNCPTPPKPTPPPQPKLPPLNGSLFACLNFRNAPTGAVLGANRGKLQPVRVLNKQMVGSARWYQVETTAPLTLSERGTVCGGDAKGEVKLGVGTGGWVQGWQLNQPSFAEKFFFSGQKANLAKTGVDRTIADWDYFVSQVRDFEQSQSAQTLSHKITALRRLGHSHDVPFDWVIKAKNESGGRYLEQRTFDQADWEIFYDYQIVRTPDGGLVDMWHLLVGLDVLRSRIESHDFLNIPIGSNYSAATWSGDIGAGVTDATLRRDAWWHHQNPKATESERATHYFESRAPVSDLLGDIDAWGIDALRKNEQQSLESLLRDYYEGLRPGGEGDLTAKRELAIVKFLETYKLRFDFENNSYPTTLLSQPRAKRIRAEIEAFANIWMIKSRPLKPPPIDGAMATWMTASFLTWLEQQAIANGVRA